MFYRFQTTTFVPQQECMGNDPRYYLTGDQLLHFFKDDLGMFPSDP